MVLPMAAVSGRIERDWRSCGLWPRYATTVFSAPFPRLKTRGSAAAFRRAAMAAWWRPYEIGLRRRSAGGDRLKMKGCLAGRWRLDSPADRRRGGEAERRLARPREGRRVVGERPRRREGERSDRCGDGDCDRSPS